MTDVRTEPTDLSAHDFEPTCDYSHHDGDAPPVWAVYYRDHSPCGCPHRKLLLFCDPCWRWRNRLMLVRCRTCRSLFPPMASIERVERLR